MLSPRVIEWTIWMTSESLPLRALSDLFCTDFLTIFFCTEHQREEDLRRQTGCLPGCAIVMETRRDVVSLCSGWESRSACGRFTAFTTPAPLQSARQSITPNRILLLQLTESQQITSSDSLSFSSGSNERASGAVLAITRLRVAESETFNNRPPCACVDVAKVARSRR